MVLGFYNLGRKPGVVNGLRAGLPRVFFLNANGALGRLTTPWDF